MEGITVLTTQNVALEYTPASIGHRMAAALIDDVIRLAWILIFIKITSEPGVINLTLFVYLPLIFYPLLTEIFFNGQSIGKRAMRIKVLMLDGTAPTVSAYLIRWMLRLIDTTLMYGVVALVTAAINGKGQRLGDIAAGTTVVKIRPPVGLRHILPDKLEVNHQVQFQEVTTLTDQHIAIIRTVLRKGIEEHNHSIIKYTALRVRKILGIHNNIPYNSVEFLETIMKDYIAKTEG